MRLLLASLLLFLLSCGTSQETTSSVGPVEDTKILFSFAPQDTEIALAVRNLDLAWRNGAGFLRFLSEIPSVKQQVQDLEDWGEDKLAKSPLDDTFLSNLKLAPENGAAIFVMTRDNQQRYLLVFAIRELEQFLGALRQNGRSLYGEDLNVEKRSNKDGEGPVLYDIKPGTGIKAPPLVFSFRDGYILLSEQESIVLEAAKSKENVVWTQVEERSPLAKENHDALLYFNLNGVIGQRFRARALPSSKAFTDTWKALSFTARLEGNVIRVSSFLSTPEAKEMRPLFDRNNGRGDLLSLAGPESVSAVRLTVNPPELWRRYSEMPSTSDLSPLRMGELFQGATGLRLSDKEDGVLDNLTGDIGYVSGPGLLDFAILFGVNKPEPFDKLLASLWSYAQVSLNALRSELTKDGIEVLFTEPREEGGKKIYQAEVRHKDIPIPLHIEAGTTSDSLVFAVGNGWLDRASARAGKGASAYYRRLYHPEVRQLFEQEPQALAYFQFLDPFEGLESTPGEMSQTIAAYLRDNKLGETIEILRLIVAHTFDAAFAFFVQDEGFLLRGRFTTM